MASKASSTYTEDKRDLATRGRQNLQSNEASQKFLVGLQPKGFSQEKIDI